MPTLTKHEPGTFSYAELATSDAAAAKKFYGGLFGWTFEDNEMGPDMTYTMAKLGDQTAGALYKMGKDMAGIPPHWLSYVTVADVDATAKKAVAAGGKLMKEPFDVMTFGRMAVLTDPTGAALAIWQAKEHIGSTVKGEPGSLAWNELYTTNVDAAGKFYVQTFGWKTTSMDMGEMGTYTMFLPESGEKTEHRGGMMAMPPDMKGAPPYWLTYFATADVDASTKKVDALGGKTMMPPTDIPNVGRFSIVQDPQGVVFALFKSGN
jgi:predicted enzyme related to lactoylglutathione lyase